MPPAHFTLSKILLSIVSNSANFLTPIDLPAHASYMVGFGFLGYWAEVWEVKSNALIAQKREAIRRMREGKLREEEMREES